MQGQHHLEVKTLLSVKLVVSSSRWGAGLWHRGHVSTLVVLVLHPTPGGLDDGLWNGKLGPRAPLSASPTGAVRDVADVRLYLEGHILISQPDQDIPRRTLW